MPVQAMMAAYKPSPVPLDHVASELATDQDGADVDALVEAVGGCVDKRQGLLDTKNSRPIGPPSQRVAGGPS